MQTALSPGYKVYPRVCGGTLVPSSHTCSSYGLSPRVRGNLKSLLIFATIMRSIPACAGEPKREVEQTPMAMVYPRVCGGTGFVLLWRLVGSGLSPRVRGNQRQALVTLRFDRSIPACAGEPRANTSRPFRVWVYPRVCGGTDVQRGEFLTGVGLSPRVRGNQTTTRPTTTRKRSIPACAGEPATCRSTRTITAVYPRVCGGTRPQPGQQRRGKGLSPRVRGNRINVINLVVQTRSIPACAGEPSPTLTICPS